MIRKQFKIYNSHRYSLRSSCVMGPRSLPRYNTDDDTTVRSEGEVCTNFANYIIINFQAVPVGVSTFHVTYLRNRPLRISNNLCIIPILGLVSVEMGDITSGKMTSMINFFRSWISICFLFQTYLPQNWRQRNGRWRRQQMRRWRTWCAHRRHWCWRGVYSSQPALPDTNTSWKGNGSAWKKQKPVNKLLTIQKF